MEMAQTEKIREPPGKGVGYLRAVLLLPIRPKVFFIKDHRVEQN